MLAVVEGNALQILAAYAARIQLASDTGSGPCPGVFKERYPAGDKYEVSGAPNTHMLGWLAGHGEGDGRIANGAALAARPGTTSGWPI